MRVVVYDDDDFPIVEGLVGIPTIDMVPQKVKYDGLKPRIEPTREYQMTVRFLPDEKGIACTVHVNDKRKLNF